MNQSLPVAQALRNQRRALILAAVLAFGSFWIAFGLGDWRIGVFVSVGIVLGYGNGLFTEAFLIRSTEGEELLSRKQFAISSLVRLMAISLVAVVLTVAFWPTGATVLAGLAVFHMIALLLTGLPLLKELRQA